MFFLLYLFQIWILTVQVDESLCEGLVQSLFTNIQGRGFVWYRLPNLRWCLLQTGTFLFYAWVNAMFFLSHLFQIWILMVQVNESLYEGLVQTLFTNASMAKYTHTHLLREILYLELCFWCFVICFGRFGHLLNFLFLIKLRICFVLELSIFLFSLDVKL